MSFRDGVTGELDFEGRVAGRGGVFRPLEDVSFFRQVKVGPEAGTIVWPNDVDFCPDVLNSLVTPKPIPEVERACQLISRDQPTIWRLVRRSERLLE